MKLKINYFNILVIVNIYLSDDVFQRNCWEYLLDGRGQIGQNDISVLQNEHNRNGDNYI